MSILDLSPEIPQEKVDGIKRNWWVFILFPLVSFFSWEGALYIERQQGKSCNDRNIYYMEKLDSTNKSDMLFVRGLLIEKVKKDGK